MRKKDSIDITSSENNGIYFINYRSNKDSQDLQVKYTSNNGDSSQVVENKSRDHEVRSETGDTAGSGKVSFTEKIFSWRVRVYLLVHTAFVVMVLPMNELTMAFVCLEDKSLKEMGHLPGSSTVTSGQFSENGTFWNGTSSYPRNPTSHTLAELNWGPDLRSLVLSGILMTSPLSPFLANKLRQFLGNKLTMALASCLSATLTFITPTTARSGPYYQLAVQTMIGLVGPFVFPIAGDTISWWVPESEKLTASTTIFAGFNVSGILSSLFAGFLCNIPIDNGWPFIFYVYGSVVALWTIAWWLLYSRKPENHPFISEAEKNYIISSRVGMPSEQTQGKKLKVKVPYKSILTSSAVWTSVLIYALHFTALNVAFIFLPLYLNLVLGFSAERTGAIFAVLSSLRIVGSVFWTILGNFLASSSTLSKQICRKLCICVGLLTASVCAFTVSFFDKDLWFAALVFIVVFMMFQAVGASAIPNLPQDIAPRFASDINAIQISVGSCMSISGPFIVTAIAPNNVYSEWRFIWIFLAGIFGCAGLLYLIAGDANIQPWALGTKANQPEDGVERSKGTENIDDVYLHSFEIEHPKDGGGGQGVDNKGVAADEDNGANSQHSKAKQPEEAVERSKGTENIDDEHSFKIEGSVCNGRGQGVDNKAMSTDEDNGSNSQEEKPELK